MFQKILHFTPLEKENVAEKKSPNINRPSFFDSLTGFIKYNNATVIILVIILILGGGALAAGPEAIGEKQTSIEGVDNTALLAADLSAFNMDFKIEKIEQDEKYYYATYSFLDLALADSAWQYQLSLRTQPVSKKIKEDIGVYLAKFLAKHYQARVRELKQEREQAESQGEQKRIEVTEYSGLIGLTLDLASAVFPGYEPVIKRELPAPDFNFSPLTRGDEGGLISSPASSADNLTQVYNDYVAEHPEIFNPPVESIDNTASSTPADSGLTPTDTASSSPDSAVPEIPVVPEASADSAGSPQAIPEPTSVKVIELPAAPAPESPAEPTP